MPTNASFLENIFVIHVKNGYEERKLHIDAHLPRRGIKHFEYILDGDIADLSNDLILDKFNTEALSLSEISCFYKHYLAYLEILKRNLNSALIIEDDAFLSKSTPKVLKKLSLILEQKENYLINIEGNNRSVPLLMRRKGKLIYKTNHTKLTGGYIIDKIAAEKLVRRIQTSISSLPIDSYHTAMRENLNYNIYWLEPPIVEQGSKNGLFKSVLSNREKSTVKHISSKFRNFYQKWIVTNLSPKRYKGFID